MNGRVTIDTNIVIALFQKEPKVRKHLAKATEVFITSIVLGELFYGAFKSSHVDANIARINEFAQHSAILVCDSITAQHYGSIKSILKAKGRPIPENDIWIAALCEQHNLVIASRDEHFKEVESITIDIW
jgi:tRNA(fMet)-specific endonuclease VapC